MAIKKIVKKDVKSIEVVKEVIVPKKQPTTKSYPLKVATKVGGVWRQVGEPINLTEGQYRDFRSKKIV
jgi:hypothetical protein